jgi:N-acetylneuraminate synthase
VPDNPVFAVGERLVGAGQPALVVGEVAQAHDGSLGTAHAFIDAIAAAGADAVKFQTHIAAAESSLQEPFRVRFSPQDTTRYDYWKRMEFTPDGWAGLAAHTRERGLLFLSSPFSEAAVDLLEQVGMPAWKIASGEVGNPLLMERIARTGKPVLLSTGMSPLDEIDRAVAQVRAFHLPLLVLQCTSRYPSQPEDVGLNLLETFRQRYACPVGISDHSGTAFPGLAAVTLGASMVEVHVALSRDSFGPDVPVSLTPAELGQLVRGVRFIEKALASPVDKDRLGRELEPLRRTFGKSLVAARDLPAGAALARTDLTARKPGTGIPAAQVDEWVGRTLARAVVAGEFLSAADFDEEPNQHD